MSNTDRQDRIEVVPIAFAEGSVFATWRPSERPHFARKINGHNGQTEWVTEQYATRSNAVRAVRDEGLRVVVLDEAGNVVRSIEVADLVDPLDTFVDPGAEDTP